MLEFGSTSTFNNTEVCMSAIATIPDEMPDWLQEEFINSTVNHLRAVDPDHMTRVGVGKICQMHFGPFYHNGVVDMVLKQYDYVTSPH
jgi:hypothetical protein